VIVRPVVAEHESAHVIVAAALGIGTWWADARDHHPRTVLDISRASPLDHATAAAAGDAWEHLAGWRAGPCRGSDRAKISRLVPMHLVREVTARACQVLAGHGDQVLALAAELARAGGVLDAVELQGWWDTQSHNGQIVHTGQGSITPGPQSACACRSLMKSFSRTLRSVT